MANKDGTKSGGRKKGTPNKLTTSVREAFKNAFDELQEDPINSLVKWAKQEPTEFYKLASKLIPIANEHSGPDGKPIEHKNLSELADDQLDERIKALSLKLKGGE